MKSYIIQKLQLSEQAWDKRFNLPTIPVHNNPWIYIGYIARIMLNNVTAGQYYEELLRPALTHAATCRVKRGVFDRWPDGTGGKFSHDEAMGLAFLDGEYADELLEYLSRTDWHYNSQKDRDPSSIAIPATFDQGDYWGRFTFLEPFLRACSTQYAVSLLNQVKWCGHVLYSASTSTPEKDSSGILKIWLMYGKMRNFFLCKLAFTFWVYRLRKKYQVTPKKIFAENYLVEVPVMAQIAPESFE